MPSYAVAGADRGLGLELINQLSASAENAVFALVHNVEASRESLAAYVQRGNVHIFQIDPADAESIENTVHDIEEITPSLDVFINNAGLVPEMEDNMLLNPGHGDEASGKHSSKWLGAPLPDDTMGPIFITDAFLPLILKGTLKKVAIISTGAADLDFTLTSNFTYLAEYLIAKTRVDIAFSEYAERYREEGVLFISISPGMVGGSAKSSTPKELEMYGLGPFQAASLNSKRPITEGKSVADALKIIGDLSPATSGQSLSHHGNKQWL
ncbi:hypothetical protein BOTBODRAFT_61929 [Botryobasidium botryosum FD-172 SS1]|uniref:NAD(P)-binding protein n=1 Tax=Botryobasidium botryosum (strain FD-172 SS1) TaxID=930990 RepID=A0A067N9T5_BOTB1|nr:hypothetical protein BOTBODRAFT_61929 [Botryobasidium botryosum FD-172 SS1]